MAAKQGVYIAEMERFSQDVNRIGAIQMEVDGFLELIPELFQDHGRRVSAARPQNANHLAVCSDVTAGGTRMYIAHGSSDSCIHESRIRPAVHHKAAQGLMGIKNHNPVVLHGSVRIDA